MKKFLILLSMGFLLSQCQSIPEPEERQRQKRHTSKPRAKPDFLQQNFRNSLDSHYSIGFLVRASREPASEIVNENLSQVDNAVLEMENSLIRKNFKVFDRAIYQDKENSNQDLNYPFDYIIEILKLEATEHPTGIFLRSFLKVKRKVLVSMDEFKLAGSIMSIKVIDPHKGEIVALINSEFVPCKEGCKIKYTETKIISVDPLKGSKKEDFRSKFKRNNGIQYHCDQIAEMLQLRLLKGKQKFELEEDDEGENDKDD